MATIDDWNKAQSAGQDPLAAQKAQQQYGTDIRGAQGAWAKQYYDSIQKGNNDPQELNRYLNYQAILPEVRQNTGLTTSAGYTGSDITEAQKQWYKNYNDAIMHGTNNLGQLDQYKGYSNILFGGQKAKPSDEIMRQLSIGALNGDRGAQSYLQAMGLNPMSGADLWNGVDTNQLGGFMKGDTSSAAYQQYLKDNPYSQFAKDENKHVYDQYSGIIQRGDQLDNNQQQIYSDLLSKWNLQDYRDPYVMQQWQLGKDKQDALNAQDVALNQGLSTADNAGFQQFQKAQQQMSDRGIAGSGIAQDAYMRAQMATNQNYQQEFTKSATTKSDIQAKFNDAISGSKINAQGYYDKQASDRAANQTKLAEIQSNQDKWMTEQTGSLYVNGQQIVSNGKPITTVEWNKMTETQRHNLTQEALDGTKINNDYTIGMGNVQNAANKNANDYNLGMTNANISATKVANDLQIALANNQLNRDKLTFDYAKLDANNKIAQDKLGVAIQNAQTSADKNQLTAWANQSNNLVSQITANQKKSNRTAADDKALQSLIDQYNSVNNSISNKVGGMSFQSSSGGGGGNSSNNALDLSKAASGDPSAFGGFRSYGKQPAAFNTHMSAAIQGKGNYSVPFSDAKLLTELIGRESGFKTTAQNPTSSAYGYGQFINSTRASYEKKTGLNYNDPVNQILITYQYVKDRYGTVQNALYQWEHRSPHWY